MQVGEARAWLTKELWKNIERVVNKKADYRHLYYIQVQFKPRYTGPAVANADQEMTEHEFKDKTILNSRLVLMNTEPIIPQLGTILFRVDNRKGNGDIYHIYTMPIDKPNQTEDSDNYGDIVPLVAQNAKDKKLPLVYS